MRHLLPLYLRIELFWAVTRRVEAISYRRFGTTYRSHLAHKSAVLVYVAAEA
jgi:hypothetical protein